MFGINFIKAQPTTYVLHYVNGKIRHQGSGISFFFYGPNSSIVSVPIGSSEAPFIFQEVTSDFQAVSIQGQITYRIADPLRVSGLLNFTLDQKGLRYASDDPEKLGPRLVNLVQVLTRKQIETLPMRQAIRATDQVVTAVSGALIALPEVSALGVEILGLSLTAIKPTPDAARALEAEAREQLLREADEAIYRRRNASIEQERTLKENEFNTEIAVRLKQREIKETEMESERIELDKRAALNAAALQSKIQLEEKNKSFVALNVENQRAEADAKAYALAAAMKALSETDPKIIQSLASLHMRPDQLVASAFSGIASRADQIGQLNISPDLLRELMGRK